MELIQKILDPFYWILNRFINNEETPGSNAPGASG